MGKKNSEQTGSCKWYIGDPENKRHKDYRKEQAEIEEEDQENQPDYGEFWREKSVLHFYDKSEE